MKVFAVDRGCDVAQLALSEYLRKSEKRFSAVAHKYAL